LKPVEKESAAVPLFVIVTNCTALTDPTAVTGKLTVFVESDATPNPAASDDPLAANSTVKLAHNLARGERSNVDSLNMNIFPSH
jgi:hypothetical protein